MSVRDLFCFCLLTAVMQPALAAGCTARFGEIIEMAACNVVALPDFEVRFVGTSQPNPGIPLTCWNYRITATKSQASTDVSQCHTGALGGEQEFNLDGKAYTVLFDLSQGCARSQHSQGTRAYLGHAFLPSTRDSKAVRALRQKVERAESACDRRERAATKKAELVRARG